jgi:PKD repeat protein
LDRFECDKTITFTNKSEGETDPINSYQWNFGEGSNPPTSTTDGSVDVTYNSFGKKTTALTVTTTRGCTVTKILDLFINACCKDTSTLAVKALAKDIDCFDLTNGQIDALGESGSPKYVFSLDSINYQPLTRFSDLKAGNYTVYIRDIKGCVNKTLVNINQPPKIIVEAGPDIEVDLGDKSVLNGSYTGGTGIGTPLWSPKDSIEFIDQLMTPFLPLKSKQYQLLVTDENGCTGTDVVNVKVKIVRPVYYPNIIKSGLEGLNGTFTLTGGKAVRKIVKLEVYDRWGNKMYAGTDLDINSFDEGWKADFNGKKVNPGVYVWLAVVEFIDDEQLTFAGDVTVVE